MATTKAFGAIKWDQKPTICSHCNLMSLIDTSNLTVKCMLLLSARQCNALKKAVIFLWVAGPFTSMFPTVCVCK